MIETQMCFVVKGQCESLWCCFRALEQKVLVLLVQWWVLSALVEQGECICCFAVGGAGQSLTQHGLWSLRSKGHREEAPSAEVHHLLISREARSANPWPSHPVLI